MDDKKYRDAAQNILDGTASMEDIELWLSWNSRASGGPIMEKIPRLLLKLADNREKHWQKLAGRFARLANWAAVEVCSPKDISSNAIDQANDIITEVGDYMIFDDRDNL